MVCLIWRQSWTGFLNKGYPLNSLLPMKKVVSRYCFHYKNLIWKFCNITMIFFIIRVCHCNSNCHCFRIMPFLFFFWKELHNQLISCSKGNFSLWIHIYIYLSFHHHYSILSFSVNKKIFNFMGSKPPLQCTLDGI